MVAVAQLRNRPNLAWKLLPRIPLAELRTIEQLNLEGRIERYNYLKSTQHPDPAP